jgi:hypothetical protein
MTCMDKIFFGVLASLMIVGCSDDPAPIDCTKDGPVLSLGTVVNATSCSISDGSIKVAATGGKEPYVYSLNELAGQPDGQFNNLHAGVYTVKVTDANGCTKAVDNVSIKASDFTFNADIKSDDSCLSGNGIITLNVESVNPPYSYRLASGEFSDNNVFTGLAVGSYSFIVKDNTDCSVTLSLTVPRGFTGTSWESDIKPIVTKSCALSGCHDGGARSDLRIFQNAKQLAGQVKSKTQDRSMPRNGTLSQDEIDLIACWVDDGALLN